MELNTDLLRWILLIGAAPIWWPFLRTLWRDFDDSLSEEGGVFGRSPGPRELERIRKRQADRPDPLISEPWARRDQPAAKTKSTKSSDAPQAPRRTRNGFGPRGKKRGFH